MNNIRCFKDRRGNDLLPFISNRWRCEVVAPLSSVRIGETSRDSVKKRDCVDYAKWVTLFVGKNESDCKKWLDTNRKAVLKLCIPYDASS